MAKAKKITGVNCGEAGAAAISPVLCTRLKEMCSLRERALKWNDPEGVHDMRVSSRRLRGALSDFSPYLRKRGLTDALKQIKAAADALGDVRDQDVAIIGLQKLAARAPEDARATLEQFVKAREEIRTKARKDLRSALAPRTLKKIQIDFAAAVDSATRKVKTPKKGSKTAGEITYVEMARSIVKERLKELEHLSNGLYHPLHVKPLHKMRIAAKRLRYALELFEQCLGPTAAHFAKKVARLQTSLGELHDADIWINAFGAQLGAARGAAKEHAAGSLWLLGHFVRLHSRHLRNALAFWQEWEASESSKQLRDSLKAGAASSSKVSVSAPQEPDPNS